MFTQDIDQHHDQPRVAGGTALERSQQAGPMSGCEMALKTTARRIFAASGVLRFLKALTSRRRVGDLLELRYRRLGHAVNPILQHSGHKLGRVQVVLSD